MKPEEEEAESPDSGWRSSGPTWGTAIPPHSYGFNMLYTAMGGQDTKNRLNPLGNTITRVGGGNPKWL